MSKKKIIQDIFTCYIPNV